MLAIHIYQKKTYNDLWVVTCPKMYLSMKYYKKLNIIKIILHKIKKKLNMKFIYIYIQIKKHIKYVKYRFDVLYDSI